MLGDDWVSIRWMARATVRELSIVRHATFGGKVGDIVRQRPWVLERQRIE
jgi:hypothetical protein